LKQFRYFLFSGPVWSKQIVFPPQQTLNLPALLATVQFASFFISASFS
jgi:hypothetical protein